ncbi:MAG: TonB-dependent receptor [Candidatus Dadabacteria bacterium]|nr:MAG: TonB-dependent receptor [Candidatus Dadabacteria bacterium]
MGDYLMKSHSKLIIASMAVVFTLLPQQLVAQETKLVRSATLVVTPQENVGSSVSVITQEEIKNSPAENVAELIKEVAGVDVVASGGPGGSTSVFIRGANSENTLVLIDGVPANDPGSPNRAYNFADLPLSNVERIEVLRGPQAPLYGSDASGGVISIYTKRGSGPARLSGSFEAGSYSTFRESAGISGADGSFDYSFGISRFDTDGISAADAADGNTEHDGYKNTSASLQSGYKLSDNAELRVYSRYIDSETELDNSGGKGGDDPNRTLKGEQFYARGELTLRWLNDKLEQTFFFGGANHARRDNNDPDLLHPLDSLRSKFNGRLLTYGVKNSYEVSDNCNVTFGFEREEERASSTYKSVSAFGPFESIFPENEASTNSYYLEGQGSYGDSFAAAAGARIDDHSQFGSEFTFRVAPVVKLNSGRTRLFGSVGSGFKAPSLSQLYSSFGNPDLNPEKSLGFDLGIEQSLLSRDFKLSVAYFHNRFKDLIIADPNTFISTNINEARTQGVEATLTAVFNDNLSGTVRFTYTDSEDKSDGKDLIRRPDIKVSGDLTYRLSQKARVMLGVIHVGRRDDFDFSTFPSSRVTLASYTLVNISGSYAVNDSLELYLRANNIFDEEYQDVLGFGTEGAAVYAGLRLTS